MKYLIINYYIFHYGESYQKKNVFLGYPIYVIIYLEKEIEEIKMINE